MEASENEPLIAIGLVFSIAGIRKMREYFDARGICIGGAGSGASGYELFPPESKLEEVLNALRQEPELSDIEVTYYDCPRNVMDGSKYDRLADHFAGPDPNRPPLDGISIGEDGVSGIIESPQ